MDFADYRSKVNQNVWGRSIRSQVHVWLLLAFYDFDLLQSSSYVFSKGIAYHFIFSGRISLLPAWQVQTGQVASPKSQHYPQSLWQSCLFIFDNKVNGPWDYIFGQKSSYCQQKMILKVLLCTSCVFAEDYFDCVRKVAITLFSLIY